MRLTVIVATLAFLACSPTNTLPHGPQQPAEHPAPPPSAHPADPAEPAARAPELPQRAEAPQPAEAPAAAEAPVAVEAPAAAEAPAANLRGSAKVAARPQTARAVTDFGLRIAQRTPTFTAKNYVISPVSIAIALGMTQAGALGETERQMAETMHLTDADHAWLSGAFGDLSRRLTAQGHTLTAANRIFLDAGNTLAASYQQVMTDRYGAPTELVEFGHAERARLHINGWVADATQKKIKDLLPLGSIDAATQAVLVNALYLAATWQDRFDPELTRPAPFRTLDGGQRNVPTMHRRGGFSAGNLDGSLVVVLPYAGSSLSMIVVMPEDTARLSKLAEGWSAAKLEQAIEAVRTMDSAPLAFPRFSLEITSHSLKKVLIALGMKTPFGPGADFSGMGEDLRGASITEVVHGARIEVDEKGTIAAASTAVVISKSSARPVSVDGPFLFFVRDGATGLVLFSGQVISPEPT